MMFCTETEARDLVVQAGHRLLASGLIARTWGNISVRLSDTQFIITPSGLAYETLRPEELVVVTIADCSYTGDLKPSSEKGIHADAYRLRPEVGFVIHTHQTNATLAGLSGATLAVDEDLRTLLGPEAPCADYGLPSTKKLRGAVANAITAHTDSAAVLLRSHGALCLGTDLSAAFSVADALETQCGRVLQRAGVSRMQAHDSHHESGISIAALHTAVALHYPNYHILHETAPEVVSFSCTGHALPPLLDDLVQIAGVNVRCVEPTPKAVLQGLRGRNAVLLREIGALCIASDRDDAEAISILLRKGCLAAQYAAVTPHCRPLGWLDATAQRIIYLQKYAKQKQ